MTYDKYHAFNDAKARARYEDKHANRRWDLARAVALGIIAVIWTIVYGVVQHRWMAVAYTWAMYVGFWLAMTVAFWIRRRRRYR